MLYRSSLCWLLIYIRVGMGVSNVTCIYGTDTKLCQCYWVRVLVNKNSSCLLLDHSNTVEYQLDVFIFFDFLLTVKAAPYECVIRTGLP